MTTAIDHTLVPAPGAAKRLRNYLGGAWRDVEGDALASHAPATGELLAHVPVSGAAEVDAAVRAARAALPGWRATSPLVRMRAVFALRELLDAHAQELVELVVRDMGKTREDAAGEVRRGIESVEAACGAIELLKGSNLEGVASGVDVELVRQPVGVVGAITPFNFPVMIPLWFLPFAIVCGNTLVLKPSEQDPLPAARIFELIDAHASLPPGVVNLVHGGRDAVNALLDHPGVDAISFVGSAATADHVYRRAAEHGKRVQALGGAKNSLVVLPDAEERTMVRGVLSSAFGAAGQRCLAGSLLVLVGERDEQDAQLERIVAGASALRCGPGGDPAVDVCPLVSAAARERVEADVAQAVAEGASLVLDGRNVPQGVGKALLGPTILDGVAPGSRMATEEIFGPVLSVMRAPDLDAALAQVNGSRFGNAAVVFTTSGGAARAFRVGVEAGMVGVNVGVAAPIAWFPFSGWKASFNGDLHANGADAIEFYTRKKVVTTRWG